MNDDQLLTTEELAKLRNCSPSKINKERLTGDGPPFIKDGHSVRYRYGDYRVWLSNCQRLTSTSEVLAA